MSLVDYVLGLSQFAAKIQSVPPTFSHDSVSSLKIIPYTYDITIPKYANGANMDAAKLEAAKNRKKYATEPMNPLRPIAKLILGNIVLPKSFPELNKYPDIAMNPII